jgi:hypothetical protein
VVGVQLGLPTNPKQSGYLAQPSASRLLQLVPSVGGCDMSALRIFGLVAASSFMLPAHPSSTAARIRKHTIRLVERKSSKDQRLRCRLSTRPYSGGGC